MKELTDEQYGEIGKQLYESAWPQFRDGVTKANIRLGRTAVASVTPILLAEPTPEERGIAGADYLAFNGAFPVDYRAVLQFTLKNFAANRLTRLNAKPDPAVEAVKAWITSEKRPGSDTEFAALIVAAVDAARAKQ